jgi:uncharacterized membrane protein YphA (DoxX/SURF4 family)
VSKRRFPFRTRYPKTSAHLPLPWLVSFRLTVAAIWIYEGLWLKLVHPAPHELAVMRSVAISPLPPERLLFVIGCGEVLLGVGVLGGVAPRLLAGVQATILVLMNGIGILFGGNSIPDPVGLVIHNLPFLMCILILGWSEPVTGEAGHAGRA